MKTLLKVLGIMAGVYATANIGALLGAGATVEMYEYPESKASKYYEKMEVYGVAKWANSMMFRREEISQVKRSDVMRRYIKQWQKQGYSSEEIKNKIDDLKKYF